jgi:hypothetical protein
MRFFGLAAGMAYLLAVSSPASTPVIPRELLEGQPVEIAAIAKRVVECSSWSGTEVASEADDRRVERALQALHCDSLPDELDTLRRKYASSARTIKAIDLFLALLP